MRKLVVSLQSAPSKPAPDFQSVAAQDVIEAAANSAASCSGCGALHVHARLILSCEMPAKMFSTNNTPWVRRTEIPAPRIDASMKGLSCEGCSTLGLN